MEWKYYGPQFECDLYNYSLLRYSPWSGHRNFAYDFMVYKNPGTLVELGSHYGSSLFSFAQAVKDHKLNTALFAVDTWEGDDYTRKYDESVYESFKRIKNCCYGDLNIQMCRCTFDEAVERFTEESIDILHIDGSHHYEDVKHDFENWKSRIKPDGIVMFHDISRDMVLGKTMGSCIYLKEIKKEYPFTLEFQHSFGLGLLFFDKKDFEFFRDNVNFDEYQQKNNELDNQFKDDLRTEYFAKKDWDFMKQDFIRQLKIKDEHLQRYEVDTKAKEEYIIQLESDIQKINTHNEKDNIEKGAYIKKLEKNVQLVEDAYKKTILETDAAYKKTIQEKDAYISALEAEVQSNNLQIACLKDELLSVRKDLEVTEKLYHQTVHYKMSKVLKK